MIEGKPFFLQLSKRPFFFINRALLRCIPSGYLRIPVIVSQHNIHTFI